MRKKIFIISILFYFVGNVTAQELFNLQQCIDYALKNSVTVKMAANDVAVAYAKKREGQSAYLPQINAQVKWDDNLKLQSTAFPAMDFGGVSIPGQTLQIGNKYNTTAGIELNQMIFNWSYIQGIKAIQPGYELAQMKKQQTEQDLIYNVAVAYYNILVINENEKLILQNEERLAKTLPIIKLQKDKGVIRQVDVDKVQVNYNNVLIQKDILSTKKDIAYNNLKYTIGMPLTDDIAIDSTVTTANAIKANYGDTANVKNRIELQMIRKNIYLQNILSKRISAGYMPQLSFYTRYAANSFGDKFVNSFNNWHDFAAIGISLDIPIFDGLRTKSSLQQAKLNIATMKEDLIQKEQAMQLQLLNANTQLQNAEQNLTINRNNIDLAKNVLDVATLQYQKGTISYTDWMASDYSYREAEQNYLNTLVQFIQSKLEVDRANNNIESYKQ
ncbi:MAG: TolC family protein [Chitinophagales bacterium]|nr:TolC family protein [Chitinophagales bacterium]